MEEMKKYIEEQTKRINGNAPLYFVGQTIIDKNDRTVTTITKKTSSSIEVFLKKKKTKGINCLQWFYITDFEKRFENVPFDLIPKSGNLMKTIAKFVETTILIDGNPTKIENARKKEVKHYRFIKNPLTDIMMFEYDGGKTFFNCSMINKETDLPKEEKKETMQLAPKLMEQVTKQTNRSRRQTQELFEFCDFNYDKLVELELKLINNFLPPPGDKEYADYVLSLENTRKYYYGRYNLRTKGKLFRKRTQKYNKNHC